MTDPDPSPPDPSPRCPRCRTQRAIVESPEGAPTGTLVVIDDPWLRCPRCGERWPAPGARFIAGRVPLDDEQARDDFVAEFVAAVQRQEGDGGSDTASIQR